MAQKRGKRGQRDASETPGFGGTFGDLLRTSGVEVPPVAEGDPLPPEPPAPGLTGVLRAVVWRERAGHGGKTVTRVEGLEALGPALEDVSRRAGAALGCGSRVEALALVVQGDQRERLAEWLRAEGVRLVVSE